jgi:hypothetical protein
MTMRDRVMTDQSPGGGHGSHTLGGYPSDRVTPNVTGHGEKRSRLQWSSASDGIAHGARPGHARTLCGVRTHDPRWSWPEKSRCPTCQAAELWPTVRRITPSAGMARQGGSR